MRENIQDKDLVRYAAACPMGAECGVFQPQKVGEMVLREVSIEGLLD